MNILNIHGYGGNPKNHAYLALQSHSCTITSPEIDYDTTSPEMILKRLRSVISEQDIDLLVGTSLGGFFAAALSAQLHLPAVLINPYLMPFVSFPEYAKPYVAIFGTLSKLDGCIVHCIIGEKDELIGDHLFTKSLVKDARFRIVPGGQHSGSTLHLPEYFNEILPDDPQNEN